MCRYDVVIVGSGHAGAQTAIFLRQFGYEGSIAIVTEEHDLPYERPPLSKEYLAGERSFERILIRPAGFWAERRITMVPGTRVIAVDPRRKLLTAGGRSIGYGTLVWAAGGSARRLPCPGASARNVHTVRGRGDVDGIRAGLEAVNRVAVVGGGYVGLEAAAVLTTLGKEVVLIEAVDRVLARVAGRELSRFYEAEHRAHGVDVRTGVQVERIETEGGTATAVLTRDGERIPTDLVIVGIGIAPESAPLTAAGALGAGGVEVDEHCRTNLADVYAIGDCALHVNRFADGARVRLESVQNATDQARTAAADIVGDSAPSADVPWFWSNQYDLKLQTVGLSSGHDHVIVRGEPSTRSFSILYLRSGRLIALDCVNSMRDYAQGRAHVRAGALLDQSQLGDSDVALKHVAPL